MSESFWKTAEGFKMRLEELAYFVVTRTYNSAAQHQARWAGIKGFKVKTAGDDRVCKFCIVFDGHRYRVGQFMPKYPKHPRCRCQLEMILA